MERFCIRDKCRINTNCDGDVFVGIKCENNDIRIHFPLGYEMSGDEEGLRKDILLLLNTIKMTTARKDSEITEGGRPCHDTAFPIQAYMAVIYDFYARGYYREREITYHVARRGKIDWNRTIKTQKPYIQGNHAYYLDFVTKKNTVNHDEIITLIHEFCVYESFSKIGWLFTGRLPEKPRLKYNEVWFRSVLSDKIASTFHDKNRQLFIHMLAIVNYQGSCSRRQEFRYGTYRFEYVWEAMIDRVYGIRDKKSYFPKTCWNIAGESYPNACLEPDTIMISNGAVYVLDAKYYKYGETGRTADLPGSTSINKQITYGEYIAEQEQFQQLYGENFVVYNAFLMPFRAGDKNQRPGDPVLRIGEACGDWKENQKSYERVQGILIDTKHLMQISTRQNQEEIVRLADQIARFVQLEDGPG